MIDCADKMSAPLAALAIVVLALGGCDRSTLGSGNAGSEEPAARASAPAADKQPAEPAQKSASKASNERASNERTSFDEAPDDKVEPQLTLSDDQWRERLSPKAYRILREGGTEPRQSGALLANKQAGTYVCAGCGKPLFSSETKYESHTGWPSFYDTMEGATVGLVKDSAHGWQRVEVYCTHCGGHLGHVFDDGPEPTGLRYCINSAAMQFEAADHAQ